uniref:Eukaryotic translation initiation factor 5 n=1 Tax=Mus spicilegus TaxID=10103 RepID=A0A8C6IHQ0_MUSSI
MLDEFIKNFVLCLECENLETDLHVNPKKQTIGNSYKACGYRGMLDTHHKLCTFILKNPPENGDTGTGKKERKNRKGKGKENGSVSTSETPPLPPANEISPPHSGGQGSLGENCVRTLRWSGKWRWLACGAMGPWCSARVWILTATDVIWKGDGYCVL